MALRFMGVEIPPTIIDDKIAGGARPVSIGPDERYLAADYGMSLHFFGRAGACLIFERKDRFWNHDGDHLFLLRESVITIRKQTLSDCTALRHPWTTLQLVLHANYSDTPL